MARLARRLALAGALATPLAIGPAPATAGATRPHIVLVSIDSLRADHVHAYGYPRETTPHLDRLAREGALFRTAVSPTSWTLPAHMTLLTSRSPAEHGVRKERHRLPAGVPTLAGVLAAAGYETRAIVSGPLLSAHYGFDRGFERYDEEILRELERSPDPAGDVTSPRILRRVERWLGARAAAADRRPIFLFLHFFDVHFDYVPPAPTLALFDPDYAGEMDGRGFLRDPAIAAGMNPRDLQHLVARYDGEIRFTDHHLGELRRVLEGAGLLDRTLLVVTSDHGDEFFEHGQKGHRRALYDESIRVPLVVRYPPRVAAGTVVERPVQLLDVSVTLLSLAGIPRPRDFGARDANGRFGAQDLGPLLTGGPQADLPVAVAVSRIGFQRSVRTSRFKLIHHMYGRDELYDLAADAGERRDLSGAAPAEAAELRRHLEAWREHADRVRAAPAALEVPEEHRRMLRALGYLD